MSLVPRALCGLVALSTLVLAPASRAQAPSFHLPETAYDYAAILGPYSASQLGPRWRGAEDGDLWQNDRATLGRVLFYDKALSRNRTRSCASCHEQSRGFANGTRFSSGFQQRPTKRNSLSLANLRVRNGGFFWDERVQTLEEMVLQPIQDPIEMGLELPSLIARLEANAAYLPLFERAFGDGEIDAPRIGSALAEFVRALVSLRSRYDYALAVAQDHETGFADFSASENRGKSLYLKSCASCHGVGSPIREQSRFEGTELLNNGVDIGMSKDDPGRGGITGVDGDRGRFRAPTLRNIELSAPYMHDGRFATLEDVVQFYAHRVRRHPELDPRLVSSWGGGGGGANLSSMVRIAPLGIALSSRDRDDLVAFLKTLTDREFTTDPRFSDPFAPRRRAASAERLANASAHE